MRSKILIFSAVNAHYTAEKQKGNGKKQEAGGKAGIRLPVSGHSCTKNGRLQLHKVLATSNNASGTYLGPSILYTAAMLKNYLRIALRNLLGNKAFSAITIFGLAIGMAACLLITLFVTDELSYDRFNKKADRVFRLDADFFVNGNSFREKFTPSQLGPALKAAYPQVENYVRFIDQGDILVQKDASALVEHNGCFADSSLFEVFTLPMMAGDPKTALTQPNSIVISERMARKYFNSVAIAVMITALTVGYRAVKAAIANPVNSLKTE